MNPINKPRPYYINKKELQIILLGCRHKNDENYDHSFYYNDDIALLEYNTRNKVVWFYENVYNEIQPIELYCGQWQIQMEDGGIKDQITQFFETEHGWTPDRIYRHPAIIN